MSLEAADEKVRLSAARWLHEETGKQLAERERLEKLEQQRASPRRERDQQIISEQYVKLATTPSAHGPDYGFLWWLNTTGKEWSGSPTNIFEARGAGGNIIFVDPGHDLVIVWRWSAKSAEGFKKVLDAITKPQVG